mmetsp:Transcript_95202/g.159869  ORF Transcript_95202/g.159869 Transcript_95202/m.159869 type:complete len:231 (+) Transcript_95202:2588-3280(+)
MAPSFPFGPNTSQRLLSFITVDVANSVQHIFPERHLCQFLCVLGHCVTEIFVTVHKWLQQSSKLDSQPYLPALLNDRRLFRREIHFGIGHHCQVQAAHQMFKLFIAKKHCEECAAVDKIVIANCACPMSIVLGPQILITEHLISFANFLEFLICLGIIWIFVRVQLPCQHIICLLDLRTRRIWGNSESLIIRGVHRSRAAVALVLLRLRTTGSCRTQNILIIVRLNILGV